MSVLICDPVLSAQYIAKREESDSSRFDEVWDNVYHVPQLRDNEHQDVMGVIGVALYQSIQKENRGSVRPGISVSDRHEDWLENYRFPDVVVFLKTNPAINHDTHWTGGPDFLCEILSPGERAYAKFDFYAKIRTREILLVFRNPWRLELHRLNGESFELVGRNELGDDAVLICESIPISFHIKKTAIRHAIEIRHTEDGRVWEG